jgi:RNA polymerase sigma-70 factor, ECF subfamily
MDLAAFVNQYRGALVGLIASWGAPWADAHEIAQESFAEAWLRRDFCRGDWRQPDVFGRWLRGVALNRYRNWARGRRRREARLTLLPAELLDQSAPTPAEPTEHLDALREAIDRLPTRLRQVVLMHYLEETSVRDVAALLSTSVKTVEGRLYRARRLLRERLAGKFSSWEIPKALLCLLI